MGKIDIHLQIDLPNALGGATSPDAAAKIRSFAKLPPGWRYGDGGPISRKVRDEALSIVLFFYRNGITDVDAFPGAGGEISLIASCFHHDIEAIVESDCTISVGHDYASKQIGYTPRLSHEAAVKKMIAIMGEAWNTSECSIRGSMTFGGIDLPRSPSVTAGGVFQSFGTIASAPVALPSLRISTDFIASFPLSRTSFGS